MKTVTRWCLTLAPLLLGGCATFHPQPLSPAHVLASFESRTLNDAALHHYLDVQLNHAVAWPKRQWDLPSLTLAAFYFHPRLKLARAEWAVAQADVIEAGQRPNPDLHFTPQYTANAAATLSPWTLGGLLTFTWETGDKRHLRIRRARDLAAAAHWKIADTAWHIRSRVRNRLVTLSAAQKQQQLSRHEQKIAAERLALIRQRLAAGVAARPALAQAESQWLQSRLALRQNRGKVIMARAALAQAIGVPATALRGVTLSFPSWDTPPLLATLPSSAVQQHALTHRADLLAALDRYAASQSTLQLAIARQFPDVRIGPGYQWDQGARKWSLGLGFSLPLLNQQQGNIALARARRREAAAHFNLLQAAIIGQLEQARIGYRAARGELALARALWRRRRAYQQAIARQVAIGAASRLRWLAARHQTLEAAHADISAVRRAQTALGKWEDAVQFPLTSGMPVAIPSKIFRKPRHNPTVGKH